MLNKHPIIQIAYYVKDVRAAAAQHAALYGSGPFFILDVPPSAVAVTYRGRTIPYMQTVALGQWGAIQVEFMQQNDNGPSVLHDLYPVGSGKTGFHHIAMFVDDLKAAVAEYARAGFPEVSQVIVGDNALVVSFVDTTSASGHFVELFERVPMLTDMHRIVADAHVGFDGRDPVRNMQL